MEKGGDFCVVGVGRTGKGGVRECLEQVSSRLGFFFLSLKLFISLEFQ